MQDYVEAIRSVVAAADGGVEISELCCQSCASFVPRPDAVGTKPIKASLQQHPQLFDLERHNGTGWTVRLAEDVTWTRTVHRESPPKAVDATSTRAVHLASPTPLGEHGIADATVSVAPDERLAMNAYIESIRKQIARADTDVPLCDLNQPSSLHFVPSAASPPAPAPSTSAPPAPPPAPAPSAPAPRKAPGVAGRASVVGEYTVGFVDTEDHLVRTCELLNNLALRRGPTTIAIACKGTPETLDLIQIAIAAHGEKAALVFDTVALDAYRVCDGLRPLLAAASVTKLFHDLHKDVYTLAAHGRVAELNGLVDTQLAAECIWGDVFIGLDELMKQLGRPTTADLRKELELPSTYTQWNWRRRPLQPWLQRCAALEVTVLLDAEARVKELVGQAWPQVVDASRARSNSAIEGKGARSLVFDKAHGFACASAELLELIRSDDVFKCSKLVNETDDESILKLLPEDLRRRLRPGAGSPPTGDDSAQTVDEPPPRRSTRISDRVGSVTAPVFGPNLPAPNLPAPVDMDTLSDIVLDVGRRPQCWAASERVFLCEEHRLATKADIEHVTKQVGAFGSDRRAGMDRKLHRISAMFSRDERIAGLTLRIGRAVRGNADMMIDLLLGSNKSILVLGEPGSGKTTIIREVARTLAERSSTIVVDTSNEIAGDGLIPHACIGHARRMFVPSLDEQSAVMVECVQNHTPHVMVIDEIGRPREVKAARTVKQRGVRMIASAHGDLRKLLKNTELNGLVGGVTTAIVGDFVARSEAKKGGGKKELQKTIAQRGGEPTFDAIVEVRRGAFHEWRVTLDVAEAVDTILEGQFYQVQDRVRDPETGIVRVKCSLA